MKNLSKLTVLAFAAISFTFASCGGENKTAETTETETTESTTESTATEGTEGTTADSATTTVAPADSAAAGQ